MPSLEELQTAEKKCKAAFSIFPAELIPTKCDVDHSAGTAARQCPMRMFSPSLPRQIKLNKSTLLETEKDSAAYQKLESMLESPMVRSSKLVNMRAWTILRADGKQFVPRECDRVGFHGSKLENLLAIIDDGFKLKSKDGGMNKLGRGVYLASKINNSITYSSYELCVLVCAVDPGSISTPQDAFFLQEFDSVYSDEENRYGDTLCVLSLKRVTPVYLLTYKKDRRDILWSTISSDRASLPRRQFTDNQPMVTCMETNTPNPQRQGLVHENDHFICLWDQRPAWTVHYLVLPKTRIIFPESLKQRPVAPETLKLLNSMKSFVDLIIDQLRSKRSGESYITGIHFNPSERQLHFHVMSETENPNFKGPLVFEKFRRILVDLPTFLKSLEGSVQTKEIVSANGSAPRDIASKENIQNGVPNRAVGPSAGLKRPAANSSKIPVAKRTKLAPSTKSSAVQGSKQPLGTSASEAGLSKENAVDRDGAIKEGLGIVDGPFIMDKPEWPSTWTVACCICSTYAYKRECIVCQNPDGCKAKTHKYLVYHVKCVQMQSQLSLNGVSSPGWKCYKCMDIPFQTRGGKKLDLDPVGESSADTHKAVPSLPGTFKKILVQPSKQGSGFPIVPSSSTSPPVASVVKKPEQMKATNGLAKVGAKAAPSPAVMKPAKPTQSVKQPAAEDSESASESDTGAGVVADRKRTKQAESSATQPKKPASKSSESDAEPASASESESGLSGKTSKAARTNPPAVLVKLPDQSSSVLGKVAATSTASSSTASKTSAPATVIGKAISVEKSKENNVEKGNATNVEKGKMHMDEKGKSSEKKPSFQKSQVQQKESDKENGKLNGQGKNAQRVREGAGPSKSKSEPAQWLYLDNDDDLADTKPSKTSKAEGNLKAKMKKGDDDVPVGQRKDLASGKRLSGKAEEGDDDSSDDVPLASRTKVDASRPESRKTKMKPEAAEEEESEEEYEPDEQRDIVEKEDDEGEVSDEAEFQDSDVDEDEVTPGPKLSTKVFYKSFQRKNHTYSLGDFCFFFSGKGLLPFVGELVQIFSQDGGSIQVVPRWFWRPDEAMDKRDTQLETLYSGMRTAVPSDRRWQNLKSHELLYSGKYMFDDIENNTNPVDSILGKCEVRYLRPGGPLPPYENKRRYFCQYMFNDRTAKLEDLPEELFAKKKKTTMK